MDTLQKSVCTYRVQLGAYSDPERASAISSRLESDTYIVYNAQYDLYAVRSGSYDNLVDASLETVKLKRGQFPDAVVINRCYDSGNEEMVRIKQKFYIQMVAFTNADKAEEYVSTLNRQYNLDAFMVRDRKDNLYKVRMGPYKTLQDAREQRKITLANTPLNDIFVRKESVETRIVNVDFSFNLQLGAFDSAEKAADYAKEIETRLGIKSKIIVDEGKQILLVLSQKFEKWEEVREMQQTIAANSSLQEPVIHLLEKKVNY